MEVSTIYLYFVILNYNTLKTNKTNNINANTDLFAFSHCRVCYLHRFLPQFSPLYSLVCTCSRTYPLSDCPQYCR
nr:MAG TPA: hypothetical protein [Caudoviricetes sp.]